jgi:chromosome segregation ATPase
MSGGRRGEPLMIEGFGYLAGQAALLLGLAAIIGILAARLPWPPGRAGTLSEARRAVEDLYLALDERDGRLRASRAEIRELRAALVSVVDRKDVEMGRLETAAIEALESTIAAHRERIRTLENQLRAAESAVQQKELHLAEERHRTKRLQAALAERDELMAKQTARRTEHERG